MHQARKDRLSVSLGHCLESIDEFKTGAWVALFGQFITLHIRITSNCMGAIGNGVWMRGRSCALSVVTFLFRLPVSGFKCIYVLVSLYIEKEQSVYNSLYSYFRPWAAAVHI